MTSEPITNPVWFDGRMPTAEDCSIRLLLEQRARERPDQLFCLFEDDSRWTYAEALEQTRRTAAGLQRLGVGTGDFVLNWLPNSAAHVRLWFATNYLGAVHVPVNISYRGGLLAHVIANSGAKLMVTHAGLADRLADVDRAQLERVVVLGGAPTALTGVAVLGPDALDGDPAALELGEPAQPWDICGIIYTSGTTGPSKGVRMPYGQLWTLGRAQFGYMTPDDRMFLMTPMCHISPISGLYAALSHGGSAVVHESFRTSEFWDQFRRTGATTVPGMGPAIMEFLMKSPPRPDDADNAFRMCNVRAASETVIAFSERFKVDYFGSFSMSETSVVLIGEVNSKVINSCGRPRTGIEVRLVDQNDLEVPVGVTGEIILRARNPWVLNAGYHGMPEATAGAWRNGWFHTGDAARRDADGNYFFVDRIKDSIRRRSENISSLEIEEEARAHPDIQDAAAIGVPSPLGDEEVLLIVSALPGRRIEPLELIRFLIPRMAHYMVPRYVRVLPELPKTPSNKVQKAGFRQEGLTPDCWDREAEGLVLKRERFEPIA